MKKDVIELVGVIVKINGKKKTFIKDECEFLGWECRDEDNYYSDNGVDLRLTDGGKQYRLSL